MAWPYTIPYPIIQKFNVIGEIADTIEHFLGACMIAINHYSLPLKK